MIIWGSLLLYAETGLASQQVGTLTIRRVYPQAIPAVVGETPKLQFFLLSDADDLVAQIVRLQEQSKPELEPLVQQYMLCAEQLIRIASRRDQERQPEYAQLLQSFQAAEAQIQMVLARYRAQIDRVLQAHLVNVQTGNLELDHAAFREIVPGAYRLYVVMTFATTTLRWFEPIIVKGGGCHSVTLTRENLMNPYWTDLNWWSFMNLDFSKHH